MKTRILGITILASVLILTQGGVAFAQHHGGRHEGHRSRSHTFVTFGLSAPYYYGDYYYAPYRGYYAPYYYEPPVYYQRTGVSLSISDIIDMSIKGVPDDVIIDEIRRTGSVFRLTAQTIDYLKQKGVTDRVIDYMLDTYR